ncbi:MAG: hypothetical protein FJY51_11480 [Betaproteobacteria bacterium]|nr:hypothetical protein [Betaproteobacteria bacterium]
MPWTERHLRADGRMIEAGIDSPGRFRLRFGRPSAWLVSYEDGRRAVKGRRLPYAFRSVEQLRYDFERDVEDAQRED